MLKLYVLPIAEAEKLPTELCETLFPARMERVKRFRRREDALRCIGAGVLIARVLGLEENEVLLNKWGKPYANHTAIHFSLSHSGDYVLLASDDSEVGADIEENAGIHRAVAERVFTPEELAWMAEDPEKRFYELWTMKESVMKLDGRGFYLPPKSFSALELLKGGEFAFEKWDISGISRQLHDCTFSVCALHPVGECPVRLLTAEDILQFEGKL